MWGDLMDLKDMLRCIEKALCFLARSDDIDWVFPRIDRVLVYLSDLPKGDDRDFLEGVRAFFVNYKDIYQKTGIKKKEAAKRWAGIVKNYRRSMKDY